MSIFNQIKVDKPKTNKFDLTHDRKFSMEFGRITPMLVMETIPGDKITLNTSQLLRFAPMIAPVMHTCSVYTHFFFVPNRLIWPNWEEFITGGEDGLSTPVAPYLTMNNLSTSVGELADYLGIPNLPVGVTENVSALPFAAYQMIYNDYYRDQNLIAEIDPILVDGDNAANLDLQGMRNRAWQHDYFTSALPWTQRGAEVTLPLGDEADVIDKNINIQKYFKNFTYTPMAAGNASFDVVGQLIDSGGAPARMDPQGNLVADLSTATAASINDIRQAFRLQEFLEKNARGGSRYIEIIASHFGVKSSDARLQRPEFLGGGQSPVTISEVLQTSSAATEPTPQGNMAGHGISVGANNNFSYFAEEHGFIIGLVTLMPKSAYQQGIPRLWSRTDKYDYYWPSFANLGEQAVLNKEIYTANDAQNDNIFGYLPRYAEYKYMNSSVHGTFKTSLDFWHMGRIFSSRPSLSQAFIEMKDAEVSRIFAVEESEQVYVQMMHQIIAERRMPYFGTPRT